MQSASEPMHWTIDLERCTASGPQGLVVHFQMLGKNAWQCSVQCMDRTHPDWMALLENEGEAALQRAMEPYLSAAMQAYSSAHHRCRH